jgi:O-acetyl-ADP-ribose deacetylase (regulator of RNase III)
MPLTVFIVDIGTELADAAARVWPEVQVMSNTDVASVPIMHGTAFVSPANSRGFMDGGVDRAYSRAMFPGIEARVKSAIRAIGTPDRVGGRFLPVGEAVMVDDLVVAPTMLLPQDVSGTRNAYLAMSAALWTASTHGVNALVVPGMCTGCGRMPPDAALAQMKLAHEHFLDGRRHGVPLEQILAEQPRFYENTEFFDIPADTIVHQ